MSSKKLYVKLPPKFTFFLLSGIILDKVTVRELLNPMSRKQNYYQKRQNLSTSNDKNYFMFSSKNIRRL